MMGMQMSLSPRLILRQHLTLKQDALILQLQLISEDSTTSSIFPTTELYLETDEGRKALMVFFVANPDGCIPQSGEECRSVMDAICATIFACTRRPMRQYYSGSGRQLRFDCTVADIEQCDLYLLEMFKELYLQSKTFDLLGGSYTEDSIVPKFVIAASKKHISRFREEAPSINPIKEREDSYYETVQRGVAS
jgi:hypothetical protein